MLNYRRIWETHNNEKIPDGYEIHHIDGNRKNNNPDNLICVSIEEHLKIHKDQKDWGAVQAILARMENKEGIKEAASKFQKEKYLKGEHNFQKIDPETRSKISKEVHKNRETAFLNIPDPVKNSSNAGKKAAKKCAGFLDTKSKNHGSNYVKNTKWWINKEGKRKRSINKPGVDWKEGMKYES